MASPSPLPWKLSPTIGYRVLDSRNQLVARSYGSSPTSVNAEFIVRAVNSHADLLAALKDMRSAFFQDNCDVIECGCASSDWAQRIDAVIAKAEGVTHGQ